MRERIHRVERTGEAQTRKSSRPGELHTRPELHALSCLTIEQTSLLKTRFDFGLGIVVKHQAMLIICDRILERHLKIWAASARCQ